MLYFKLLFLILTVSLNLNAEKLNIVVVVSKKSTIDTISKQQLSKIFLSKTKKLPNGNRAITLENTQAIYQKIFYKNITGKNENQLKKYWAKMIFTGKGFPPKKIKDTKSLIMFIENNIDAIAYMDKSDAIVSNLKVIFEI